MISQGIEVLKLNIGNPAPFGFRAPEEVIYDMASNLRDSEGYSDSKGIWSARKAIMQYAQTRDIPNLAMSDIYTGNGVSELINLCLSALLENGDEILIPAPDYPLWTACATAKDILTPKVSGLPEKLSCSTLRREISRIWLCPIFTPATVCPN